MTTKSQKAFNRLAFANSAKLLNNCSSCGKVREAIKFEDLPEASKKGFKELVKQEPYKSGATFLYCRECKEYSILSNPFH
jgi:hypothetical protein